MGNPVPNGTVSLTIGEQSPPLKEVNVRVERVGEMGECDKYDRCCEEWGKKWKERI